MKSSRITEMYNYISQFDKVSLKELAERFGISMSTLRRDIQILYEQGKIEKQYGYVSTYFKDTAYRITSLNDPAPYHPRSQINTNEKNIIAKLASKLVEDDDVIFIDSGSTTALMVEHMEHLKHVTIVTNNLDVVMRAQPYSNLDIYILPGLYKRSNNSFSLLAESYIYDYYNIKKAFIACTGISLSEGVSHTDLSERIIKQCTISHTKNCYLLVDHTKFDYVAPLHLCDIKQFTAICTDIRPPKPYVDFCQQHNVGLYFETNQNHETLN